ncbi:MAG: glutamate--tRNA ligase [Lentisphaeraceae bacterium]|nr:glutamate--tRNA ligase [Lentisphaeraceae bacterium]
MSKEVRVRFAPSPTGHVHIGNIRAAIFNWLYARKEGGKFLLRIEDTDKERSTPEAIDSLLECMEWLGLDFDEAPFYQSSQAEHHIATAEKLMSEGRAYKYQKGEGVVTFFRMPWDLDKFKCIKQVGAAENTLHPDLPLILNESGISFGLVSKKGKAVPQEQLCLAGFRDLKLFNAADECVFELNDNIESIYSGEKTFEFSDIVKMTFTRHSVTFTDIIKGELAKPMDSMKDLVIVKSDGSPLFHLANICDDITQKMSHIVRGDDHVENTYRHVVIFEALGAEIPEYAHLPMIVNASGKPYSKRDGDAFVGDFRTKGYLSDSLFNYLTLLGWSPGDQEKVSRTETVDLFSLERVKSTAAQMDMDKLYNLNGQYIAEMSAEDFIALSKPYIQGFEWFKEDDAFYAKVATLMHTRTKLVTQVDTWGYFFTEGVEPAESLEKVIRKTLKKEGVADNLKALADAFEKLEDFTGDNIEAAIIATAETLGLSAGKLNKPIRLAATAAGGGADLLPTLELVGQARVVARLRVSAERDCV